MQYRSNEKIYYELNGRGEKERDTIIRTKRTRSRKIKWKIKDKAKEKTRRRKRNRKKKQRIWKIIKKSWKAIKRLRRVE